MHKLTGENIRVVYGVTGEMIAEYDGKRTTLQTSGARTIVNPYADRETDKQKAVAVLMQSALERVAAGREVEIKLGETEVTLDEAVLKNVREFVKALSH